AEVIDEINRHQVDRIIHLVKQKMGGVKGKDIAILGLTYKPGTDIVEPSAPIEIAKALLQEEARLSVYDPAGIANARIALGDSDIEYAGSVEECLMDAEFCILATPWQEFNSLEPDDFTNTMKRPRLLDCWRILDRSRFSQKLEYMAIGLGPRC
ncbi:UDP binding domain-containing protein, partial [Chloroflexota bacterium]